MSSTMRTHISKEDSIVVRATSTQKVSDKPNGFWYSVDGGWEEWCKSEMPHWVEGRRTHRIYLGEEKILRVGSVHEIDLFDEKYRVPSSDRFDYDVIDWKMVAKEYDGIEIAPYQWDRRLNEKSRWYYGWDCASGCIWRPKGMKVELIRDSQVA